MEAKDLRIGNYVSIKPTALHHEGSGKDKIFQIKALEEIVVYFKDFSNGEHYQDLEPIPLDEEWLKRFGFYEFSRNFWDRNDFYALSRKHWYYSCEHTETDIRYVHQLQNLFYAISGKELKA